MCAVIICGIRVKDKIPAEFFKFLAYFTFFSHFLFSGVFFLYSATLLQTLLGDALYDRHIDYVTMLCVFFPLFLFHSLISSLLFSLFFVSTFKIYVYLLLLLCCSVSFSITIHSILCVFFPMNPMNKYTIILIIALILMI